MAAATAAAAAVASYREILKGGKYPAKEHARKTIEQIRRSGGEVSNGILYLEAQKTRMIEDCDEPVPFRQRRYFYYLTGCELADSYFAYDLATGKSTLFIPPIDPEEVIWSGLPMSTEEALNKYDVDEVLPSTEVNAYLASKGTSKSVVYAIPDQVSDDISFLNFDVKDLTLLKPAIEVARVVKTPYEIALIRHANVISTIAHTNLMKAVKTAKTESQLEALFFQTCIANDLKEQAYHPIVAAGTSAATLHYVHNNAPISHEKQLLLVDGGAEANCYASDITRTFPISGTFTPKAKAIYDTVLRMQEECLSMLKADVKWDDVHAHAHRVAIQGLQSAGILRKEFSVDEIFEARTSVAFFPHGLGHYLGMDTHDVGGNPNYSDKDTMFRYLRVRGTLPEGSVVTVEPGVYFCRFIVEPYLKDEKHKKYIDEAVLDQFWDVGGVRIEDNVLITKDGYENLTDTPKAPEDMLKLINGA